MRYFLAAAILGSLMQVSPRGGVYALYHQVQHLLQRRQVDFPVDCGL